MYKTYARSSQLNLSTEKRGGYEIPLPSEKILSIGRFCERDVIFFKDVAPEKLNLI